jgi:hypothetical protein
VIGRDRAEKNPAEAGLKVSEESVWSHQRAVLPAPELGVPVSGLLLCEP